MNDEVGMHAPTPEFRDALEREIALTWRREQRLAAPSRFPRASTLRTMMFRATTLRAAAMLIVGVVLGAGAGIASAQVKDARQRDSLSMAMASTRQLAAMRLELTRAAYDRARLSFDAGALSRESLLASESEWHAAEAELARIELDLKEIAVTSAAPRDELWAPLVAQRDFVKERLEVQGMAAQQQYTARERSLADVVRAVQAGAQTALVQSEAETSLQEARRDLAMVAQKLALRQEFLSAKLTPDVLTRRLQRFELMQDVQLAEMRRSAAQQRATLLRQRRAVGAADELEVKRAEVEALARAIELQRLNMRLQALKSPDGQ